MTDLAFIVPLLAAAVVSSMPVGIAAVGECVCQKTGILNLGLEGMMLSGALAAFLFAFYTGDPWLGVIAGVVGGLLPAVLFGLLSITLKAEQVVSGIVIVLLAHGFTSYLYGSLFHVGSTPPRIERLEPVAIPVLSDIPVLGPVLFNHSLLLYLSLALIVGLWWFLERTSVGLVIKGAGEKPEAVDAAGVSVDGLRWLGVLISGGMAGLAGAFLVVVQLGLFADGVTTGRGWIAIALVIFGRWKPMLVFGGALFFGLIDAVQLRFQILAGGIDSKVPFEIFQVMPYLVTLVVLVWAAAFAKRNAQPSALAIPFFKGGKH